MAKVSTEAPFRCVGVIGRLFGHKFIKRAGGYVWPSPICYRCGMPEGGWK